MLFRSGAGAGERVRTRGCPTVHLLGPEVVSHEVLLQLLVGVVDAELLQAVVGERLKPIHVQQAWGARAGDPWGLLWGYRGLGGSFTLGSLRMKLSGHSTPPQGRGSPRHLLPLRTQQEEAEEGEGSRPQGPRVPPSLDGLGLGHSVGARRSVSRRHQCL